MSSKGKVLLVDDEPSLLKVSEALLEAEGFSVTVAPGGKSAITELSKQRYDLVLLDLNMPEINGLDVMGFINTNRIQTNVIVLSGESSFEWVSKAFNLGAFDYLKKPYEFDALLNTIKNAFEKRDLELGVTKLQKKLKRSEKLHRFMIESSPDIIFIIDSNDRFAFVNKRAQELLGYRKDELIGEHFSYIVEADYLETAEYSFKERREGERAQKDNEVWLTCKTGVRPDQTRTKIAVELNSLGVYEYGVKKKDKKFSGTYVVARDITERLASEKLIHYQAYHDLLTGLPNRALFLDRLNTAISNCRREDDKLTVMFLDLDRFKAVNDTLGHAAGDELLKQAANRLTFALRKGDSLARLGGDEFIVLLPKIDSNDAVHKVAEKIVDSIKEPFYVDGHEIYITTSIGIAVYPEDGDSAEMIIKNSDVAMYHTKGIGKNGYNLYKEEMRSDHHRTLNFENDIRQGIKEDQFELYYQPQINAKTGKVIGVEALLRWNHPKRGLLTPSSFLALTEETGLIVELGDWVVNNALQEMQKWRKDKIDVGRLAINVSSKQISQKDFVDKIIRALNQYSFPGSALEIEITETTLIEDIENTVSKLKQLSDVGVQVAIDDFGTGYSSLSLLQKLPINRLKIDRSFVQDMQVDSGNAIIEGIIYMAKSLKLDMVAEGVEEEYQLNYLKMLNCPTIQGYIFSKGVPAEEARILIENEAFLVKDEVLKYSA